MAASSVIRVGQQAFDFGGFSLRPTGLVVRGRPSFAEWQACGAVLERIEGAIQWWIGDWLNYGEKVYGEKYAEAIASTRYDPGTLRNLASVAHRIELSRRRDNVPYSVHAEVAALGPNEQDQLLERAADEELTVSAVRDVVRQLAHGKKIEAIARGALPAGEYDVVLADPPWQYDNSGFQQSAAAHYPTMATDAIASLPASDPTFPKFANPSVLFLWATSPLLPAALTVLGAWGFDYKAHLVWVKDRAPAVGWWLQTRHELLLVGVAGSITPLEKVDSVIEALVDAHSQKPIEAYAAIDRMFPGGLRRVECFARTARPGWAVWGNEV